VHLQTYGGFLGLGTRRDRANLHPEQGAARDSATRS